MNWKALGKVVLVFLAPISIMAGARFLPPFWVGVIGGSLFVIFMLILAYVLYDIFNSEDKYE